MEQVVYTILFIISFFMLIFLVSYFRNRISVFYSLLFASILVTNFGYMQLSFAKTVEMAILANQVVYLGASFSPFFLLMCLADLCKATIKMYYQKFFLAFSCAIFALTLTIGKLPWYYKSVSLITENGASVIVKEYGPLHNLYPIYLGAILIAGIVIVSQAIIKQKDVSYLTSIFLFVSMYVMIAVYVGEKAFHLKVELLPAAYVLAQLLVLFLLRRISLYDVTTISANSMVESLSYGFVLVDSKGRFLGADPAAKVWFPEVMNLGIDRPLRTENTDFLRQLGQWFRGEAEQDIVYYERNGCIIEAKHMLLEDKKDKSIHCVYLRDDTKQQKYTQLVEKYNENLEHDVNEKTDKIRQIQNDIIISMASIVENRDNNTGGHIARTSDIMKIFVNHLLEEGKFENLTQEVAERIIKAAPLHDFGKIAIPDVILNKPGKFTDEEYAEMKKHSAKGAGIVERILQNSEDTRFKEIAVNVAHYHHEKWDGNGYPERISGNEIPFEARVMALADVFDALVSKRVYKDSFSYDKAFAIIEESGGSHFDPELCSSFLSCRDKFEALYNSYDD